MPIPSPIQYSISEDTLNGAVAGCLLKFEIDADPGITPEVDYISTVGDVLLVNLDADLLDGEKAALDAIVAAHAGVPPPNVVFRASSSLVGQAMSITQSDWETVNGVVTNVGFFMENVLMALGRVVGEINTNGTVDMRLVREPDGDAEVIVSTQIGDTSSAWEKLSFTSNPGISYPSTEQLYCLQAKLVGASAAQLRFTSMTLLEIT